MKLVCNILLLSLLTISLVTCERNLGTEETIICITFDDQHLSSYTNGLPILENYGYKATSFINSEGIGSLGKLNWEQMDSLCFDFGWEIGGHTLHHIDLTQTQNEIVYQEIKDDFENLQARGYNPKSFALPSGHASNGQFEIIEEFYDNIRTSQDLQHYYPINRLKLGYFPYYSEYEPSEIKARILRGVAEKESLIIIGFHSIEEEDENQPTNCTPSQFENIVSWIYANGFEVCTLQEAIEKLIY